MTNKKDNYASCAFCYEIDENLINKKTEEQLLTILLDVYRAIRRR